MLLTLSNTLLQHKVISQRVWGEVNAKLFGDAGRSAAALHLLTAWLAADQAGKRVPTACTIFTPDAAKYPLLKPSTFLLA